MTGLSLTMVIALVVGGTLLSDGRREVDTGATRGSGAEAGAAAKLLRQLAIAITEGDREEVDGFGVGGALSHLVPNAQLLRVRDLDMRYVDEVGAATRDGAWLAEVDVTWRLDGLDRGVARVPVIVGFRRGVGDVLIDEIAHRTTGGARAPLWLTGPVSVARADLILAVVAGNGAETRGHARDLLREARRGVNTVRATLADWDGVAVIEEPATADGLDAALAAVPSTHASIAAVTAAVDGSSGAATPVRILLNPDVMQGMTTAARLAVIAHELTHVATSAHTSGAEPWLVEGFADWVALRGTLSAAQGASRAIEDARVHGLPEELPGPDAFASAGTDLQIAYEQAWLTFWSLANRIGADDAIALYTRADSGEELGALLGEAGTSERQLLNDLRAVLRTHAWDSTRANG